MMLAIGDASLGHAGDRRVTPAVQVKPWNVGSLADCFELLPDACFAHVVRAIELIPRQAEREQIHARAGSGELVGPLQQAIALTESRGWGPLQHRGKLPAGALRPGRGRST